MKNAPFFAVYNVGTCTFAPYKVIWAEMTGNFCAAVATSGVVPSYGKRVYVPDHKLYFVDFADPKPAYFLCGLLHAGIVKEMIEAHNIATNMGDIFKHVNLPRFNADDSDHIQLAELVKSVHSQQDATLRAKMVSQVQLAANKLIEAEIQRRRQYC